MLTFPIHIIYTHGQTAMRNQVVSQCCSAAYLFAICAITAMLLFKPIDASAQDGTGTSVNPFTNEGDVANPRAPRRDGRLTIRLTKRECRHVIVGHSPSSDVAYKPGVDVRGNPVTPADLPSGYEWVTPTEIEFDLAFNPLGNTGLDPDDFSNTSASVGRVKYDILSDKLTLNGRPLADPLLAVIESQCRAAGLLD